MSMSSAFERFSRRDLMRIAASSIAGVSCSSILPKLAMAAGDRRPPKACILLWMAGGPSQQETLDPKPDHRNGGPTKAIQTPVLESILPQTFPVLRST